MARGKSNDNAEILEYALRHLEKERDEIQARIDSIHRQLGRRGAAQTDGSPTVVANGHKKRVLSEAARKRIAAAQKRRWAEHRKQQSKTA